jgi:drug/metabolite transporter (DMT)-like permease
MLFACGATLLFSGSVLFARRSGAELGPWGAFTLRTALAFALLLPLALLFGTGFGGPALAWFVFSGAIGFGLSDWALFRTLDRLGSRLSLLMVQCLAAPFAVAMEAAWLGTHPTAAQLACAAVILGGVALALAPDDHPHLSAHTLWSGVAWGTLAAFGQGAGAVISRKGFAVAAEHGAALDALSSTAQRMLGGLLFVLALCLLLWRAPGWTAAGLRRGAPWSFGNALAGPILGVTCYQAALRDLPSGIVLPIVATAPLVVLPMTWVFEGDRPTARALAGSVISVAGLAGLFLV